MYEVINEKKVFVW